MPDHGNTNCLELYLGPEHKSDDEELKLKRCNKIKSVVKYAARTLEPIRLSKTDTDKRFPDGLDDEVKQQKLLSLWLS